VTLQTLHPEKFDHGTILAQTPHPGLPIPRDGQCTYQELLDFITSPAAEILVRGIRDRVFDPLLPPKRRRHAPPRPLRPAPKITTHDRLLDWSLVSASDVALRDRVLGRLWFYITTARGRLNAPLKRAVMHGVKEVRMPLKGFHERSVFFTTASGDGPLQEVAFWKSVEEPGAIVVFWDKCGDGTVLVREITVEGGKRRPAWQVLNPENGNEYSLAWNNYSSV
jgi:methionyl-tRNA formyltransferase